MARAIGLVWRASPTWTLVNAATIIVQALMPLALVLALKDLFDALAQAGTRAEFGTVMLSVGLVGAIALAQALLGALARMSTEALGQIVTDDIFLHLQAKAITIDVAYYEDASYRDTLHRAQMAAPYRPRQILGEQISIIRNLLVCAVMGALLVSFHWLVLPLLLAAGLPGVWLRMRLSREDYSWERRATADERLASYYNEVLNSEGHAKDLRLLSLGPYFQTRFRELRDRLRASRLRRIRRRALHDFAGEAMTIAGVVGLLAMMGRSVVTGEITIGTLMMYVVALQRAWTALGGTLHSATRLFEDSLFLRDLFEFLDRQPVIREPASPRQVPRPIRESIRLENVSFTYPTADRAALRDIDLEIRAGEHVALVGLNGSGKTSLVKLLCRLYDPSAGRITVDGIDLREFSPDAWRAELGVLMQEYTRFQLTARENIRLGDQRLPFDSPRIEEAAGIAGARAIIDRLPAGFETRLGHRFKDGHELSIGQWQSIATARLLVRDAQLLILDEPTSALDPKAEDEVLRRFDALARNRTAILISHRLSAVRMADTICMLEGGRIVERGSHDALMHQGGAYAQLYALQAKRYRD